MTKRILTCFLLTLILVGLAGCGKKEDKMTLKEAYRMDGIEALDDERYDKAIELFLLALKESNGFVKEIDFDINYYLGYAYYQNGEYEKSIETFDSVLAMKDKETEAYYYRALANLKLQRLSEAEADFLKVTAKNPSNYDTYIDIYFCLCDAGYEEIGSNYLLATLENGKNMSEYDKGRICYYLGDYSNARVCLEKAKDMSDPDTILMLGKTYEAIDDYSYAASLYNTYISDKGNNAAVYNQLGVCRLKMNDYEAAQNAFTSGLNLQDPAWEQELLYNQAITYEYMLDFSEAYEKMGIYLEKYPKDEDAKREYEFLSTRI